MGYVNIDVDALADLELDDKQTKLFLNHISKIELTLRAFDLTVSGNVNLCPICIMRRYVKLALNWPEVIQSVQTLREFNGDITLALHEFLLSTYFTSIAEIESAQIIEFGEEEIERKQLKDKNIDVLRVYGMMMNLFMKETLKKILDNFTGLLYDMKVKKHQVHYLMTVMLENIMSLVGRFLHVYNEKAGSRVIYINKVKSRNNEGLACEEPLVIEYTVGRKGHHE